jgi:carboxyl-terminal processing protease
MSATGITVKSSILRQITQLRCTMANKKLQVWLPLIFSIVMIAGMIFGYKLNDQTGGKKSFLSADKRGSLQQALDLIRLNYVDSVHTDSLEGKAIQEMMNELDPHSVYFPPVELQEVNDELKGKFEGIGVEFNIFRDTVNVMYVIPGGPSDKAGLQIGDKILKVNDRQLTGKPLETEEVKKLIRGEKASKVEILLLRGTQQKTFVVTRGTIPVSSIDAAYMVDSVTGYIKLNKFTQTSYEETMRSLEQLQKQGMKQLVFDLRGNGGGFMNEAVDIVDAFLDGNKLIVYTKGVNNPKVEYRAKRPGEFEKIKLAILIDELSASASEVLAGALQDWDRAVIVGRRSFGKGLVQQQYDLNDGSAIRLTIARYYTPLGRSIQRPYDKGRKVYMDEIWNRFSSGEMLYADSVKYSQGQQYKTLGGKIVYGGGGIMPDIFVPIDTSRYSSQVNRLLVNGDLNRYVYYYYLTHRQQIDQYPDASAYTKNFTGNGSLWQGFIDQVKKDSIDIGAIPVQDKESLLQRLTALLARFRWRNSGFYQVLNSSDQMVKKATEAMYKN